MRGGCTASSVTGRRRDRAPRVLGWGVIVAGVVLGTVRRIEVARRRGPARPLEPAHDATGAVGGGRTARRCGRAPGRVDAVASPARPRGDSTMSCWGRCQSRSTSSPSQWGAGCTPYRAVTVAARWSPPQIGAVLEGVERATAMGTSFDEALRTAGAIDSERWVVSPRRCERAHASDHPPGHHFARLAEEVRADVRRRRRSFPRGRRRRLQGAACAHPLLRSGRGGWRMRAVRPATSINVSVTPMT